MPVTWSILNKLVSLLNPNPGNNIIKEKSEQRNLSQALLLMIKVLLPENTESEAF